MRVVARLLVLLPLLWVEGAWAVDCPSESYDLSNQSQVDSFPQNCDTVTGDLIVAYSSDVTDLTPFSNLVDVGGLYIYYNTGDLTSLDGLENLTTVRGQLTLMDNPKLADISALSSVSTIYKSLSVNKLPLLTELSAFSLVTELGWYAGFLYVYENSSLVDCTSLRGLLGYPNGPDNVPSTILLRDNATGCNSVSEIFAGPPPTITSVSPATGATGGGYQVIVSGTYFGDTNGSVTIGGSACAISSWTANQIVCDAPEGAGANLTLEVSVDNQTASASFSYDPPTISSLSILAGATAGGYSLTVNGNNLGASGSATISIGGSNCPITSSSHTHATCTVPEGVGADQSLIIDVAGQVATSLFSYNVASVDSISPTNGPTTGGTTLTLTGANFGASAGSVSVGGSSCQVETWSHTSVTCLTPAGQGVQGIVSLSRAGDSATASQTFSYNPPVISALSATSGSASGGNSITISGSNFGLLASVTVGGVACPVTSQNHSQIVCTVPSGQAGSTEALQVAVSGQVSNTISYLYKPVYTVTPSAGDEGTISPSSPVSVEEGSTYLFTASPDQHYQVASFDGTCGGQRSGNTFTTASVTQDCTVIATFERITYSVSPSANTGGSISPSEPQVVNSGETAGFTLTPATSYEIAPVTGTCGGTLNGSVFTTAEVTGNCTVIANFTDISGTIVPEAPTVSLGSLNATSAQINFASNGYGSDPISSYSVSCEIPAIAPSQSLKRTQTRSIALGSPTQQKLQRSNADGENAAVGRIYSPSPQLNGAVVGDLLEFEAPSGAKEQGLIVRAEVTRFGNYLVQAKSDESEMLAVVVEDGNFISRVSGPSGVFQSQILEGNSVVYSEADGELVDNPFINDMLIHDFAESQNQDIEPAELSANPTVISVGIQYDNATRDAYDEIALAEYYVYVANESYHASDVDIRFEIVDTRNYEPYISNSTLGETLRYITCGTTTCSPVASYNSDVKAWRDQVKADLVVQLVRYGITVEGRGTQCGVGWTPSTAGDFLLYLPQLAFSVNAIESRTGNACEDIVVAHEMGHNFGLFHDRETDAGSTGSPYYSYAHGHKVSSIYGTVMSYSPVYVYALSNPNKTFNGSPIGVPIGQSGEAFAAQAVANVMSIHEDIYDNTTATYHTVTSSAGNGGSISPSSASVLEGNTTSFAVTPNSDYSISSVTGCNGSLSGSTYTTGAITAPCTVTASFQRYRWTQTTSGNSLTLTGLPTGYQFSCRGYATNLAGDSALSSPISFTTQAPTVPSRPNILKTDFGDGEIYLYVSSSSNGGSAITGYTATCTDGTNTFTGTSTSSPITVSGLTNDVAYTCTVTATNSVGTSTASAATDPITPEETASGLPIWLLYQATQ